jgi:DNA uptake protein ComE-like DNA-binding protein
MRARILIALPALLAGVTLALAQRMTSPPPPPKPGQPFVLVDINSAKLEDLKKLPGIDQAEAEKIVEGRPYRTKDELLRKNVLSSAAYARIRDHVFARRSPAKPAPEVKPAPQQKK